MKGRVNDNRRDGLLRGRISPSDSTNRAVGIDARLMNDIDSEK